jgi:hypothetical protein
MANMLAMAALEFGDPMLFALLVKANDSLLHESEIQGSEVIGYDVILFRTGELGRGAHPKRLSPTEM